MFISDPGSVRFRKRFEQLRHAQMKSQPRPFQWVVAGSLWKPFVLLTLPQQNLPLHTKLLRPAPSLWGIVAVGKIKIEKPVTRAHLDLAN